MPDQTKLGPRRLLTLLAVTAAVAAAGFAGGALWWSSVPRKPDRLVLAAHLVAPTPVKAEMVMGTAGESVEFVYEIENSLDRTLHALKPRFS